MLQDVRAVGDGSPAASACAAAARAPDDKAAEAVASTDAGRELMAA